MEAGGTSLSQQLQGAELDSLVGGGSADLPCLLVEVDHVGDQRDEHGADADQGNPRRRANARA